MKNVKSTFTILIILTLILAPTRMARAQSSGEMQEFFSRDYAGISVKINATAETVPEDNMTVIIWTNCTAEGVTVEYMSLDVYGFINGTTRTLLNSTHIMQAAQLDFNVTNECNYTIAVPSNVWEKTYAELFLKYSIKDWSLPEYDSGFAFTTVRNVYLENLEKQLRELNETYSQLNSTYWQLNGSYKQLNETYWQLYQNYTSLRDATGELDNARRVAVILAITTVFFVATTAFMLVRKPKKYW